MTRFSSVESRESGGRGEVATAKGVSVSLDSLTEKTVGGRYCRRASNFHDTAIPSEAALHHRALKVSLIYELVVKHRGLRDVRSERSRQTGADDSRDRRDGDRGRSRSDVRDDDRLRDSGHGSLRRV